MAMVVEEEPTAKSHILSMYTPRTNRPSAAGSARVHSTPLHPAPLQPVPQCTPGYVRSVLSSEQNTRRRCGVVFGGAKRIKVTDNAPRMAGWCGSSLIYPATSSRRLIVEFRLIRRCSLCESRGVGSIGTFIVPVGAPLRYFHARGWDSAPLLEMVFRHQVVFRPADSCLPER